MCAEPPAPPRKSASSSKPKKFCARPQKNIPCAWSPTATWTAPQSTQHWRPSRKSSPKKRPQPPPTDPPSVPSLLQLYFRADCRTGPKAAPTAGRQPRVHTQRFAFRAPQEDDESVKMCAKGTPPSSVLPSVHPATPPRAARRQNRRFLFSTNEPLSPPANFPTLRKHGTSLFLFSTNERSP